MKIKESKLRKIIREEWNQAEEERYTRNSIQQLKDVFPKGKVSGGTDVFSSGDAAYYIDYGKVRIVYLGNYKGWIVREIWVELDDVTLHFPGSKRRKVDDPKDALNDFSVQFPNVDWGW